MPSHLLDTVDLGGSFTIRYQTHERLGDSWILVTPAKNWFHTSHADAAHEILSRSRDFGRPVWMMSTMTYSFSVSDCKP